MPLQLYLLVIFIYPQIIQMNQRWQAYNENQEQQIHGLNARIAELEQLNKVCARLALLYLASLLCVSVKWGCPNSLLMGGCHFYVWTIVMYIGTLTWNYFLFYSVISVRLCWCLLLTEAVSQHLHFTVTSGFQGMPRDKDAANTQGNGSGLSRPCCKIKRGGGPILQRVLMEAPWGAVLGFKAEHTWEYPECMEAYP